MQVLGQFVVLFLEVLKEYCVQMHLYEFNRCMVLSMHVNCGNQDQKYSFNLTNANLYAQVLAMDDKINLGRWESYNLQVWLRNDAVTLVVKFLSKA